ncbi:TetR/AcrR family transcriptional regulator C-terminal domain-containing protein [Nocardia carnea]|uniref:TetR/AcrR family transcriptional regulator C-terminal domain-containing protein n=1 Tax=Nocardia carnea TaxID=37328 RepID=UPI0024539CF0|nr:TetR/AcrR family transcriptional regulator C-terminal domain-containing protein [Nocardia carnea]
MAKQGTATKRPRRERGSLNPDDIVAGAFELAEEISIDNLSMPLLGKHLGVGVTSIYWYFRKKEELLNAMTDRALRQYAFETPFIEAEDWRETLRKHAQTMRQTFLGNPILCDLILIRSALSKQAARLGGKQTERVIASLVEAGFSLEAAVETYSRVQLHVHGFVVLQRLSDKNRELSPESTAYYENVIIDPETTPLLAQAAAKGYHSGAPDDRNFEHGLDSILDHASRLLSGSEHKQKKPAPARRTTRSTAAKTGRARTRAAAE